MSQRAEQRLAIEPRLLQSIEVLALPAVELDQYLRDAFERNEALNLEEPRAPLPDRPVRLRRGEDGATTRHSQWLESLAGPTASPRELLLAQFEQGDFAGTDRGWLELLVECLDDNGILREDDAELLELARRNGLEGSETELGRAIAALQTFEPRGIGARDTTEVLLLQLEQGDEDYGSLCTLIEHHLADLERNRLPKIAKDLGVDLERLAIWIERLGALSPRPLEALDESTAPVVAPDLVVEWDGDRWHLESVRGGLPVLTIDPEVAALARSKSQSKDVRERLRGRVRDAQWLVESLERREATLLRVAAAALERQPRFFERGPAGLEPLQMTDVAEELGLHTSTVSRAVSGKSVQTPFGVIALRDLFPKEAAEGSNRSRGEAAELIRELVAGEDGAAPLSDEDLVRELARRGLKVARRTVAKHRTELGIPSSYRRRAH